MTQTDGHELISVIMPAYNCEATLEEAVISVLGQTYPHLELLIVDDASEDGTPDICRRLAEQDKRVRYIRNKVNCGALKTRITAADNAAGEWIAFIDADDLWMPDKLEKQLKLRDGTDCDIIYTASAFMDDCGNRYDWIMHVPEQVGYRKLLKQNIISNSSVLMRKTDYIRFSPPDESSGDMHEDFACWLGMLREGFVARGIDEPLITYRISARSSTGNKIGASRMNMNTYKYLKLGFFERHFYQTCYAVNGLFKYRHFR